MLRVTPLSGSRWSEEGQALEPDCSLIEFSDCRILCNLGALPPEEELPPHDCVFITDSTLQSLGALPMYRGTAPIYATFPTVKMGQMTLYDHHAALSMDGVRPPFTLEELDAAVSAVICIKYSQSIHIGNLSITAQRAGHVVGGAFYTFQRVIDETVVLFTATYNMARELHLDSSTLLKQSKPDALITRPGGIAFRQCHLLTKGRRPLLPSLMASQAERELVESVLAVLRRDGNVLLPADASGRVIELILILQQHWEKQRLGETYNLVWLGPLVQNTAEFARCQLEWMSDRQGHAFDTQQSHPLRLNAVHFFTSAAQLQSFIERNNNPTCVVASGLTLDHGPARDVFLLWADNPDNAVIFTDSSQCYLRQQKTITSAPKSMLVEEDDGEKTSPWTAAGQLMCAWTQAKREGREMDDSIEVDVLVPQRSPLMGEELKRFLESEEEARIMEQKEEEKRAMLREVELAKGQLRLGDDEPEVKAVSNVSTAARPKKKSRFDSTLFLKFSKPLHRKCICSPMHFVPDRHSLITFISIVTFDLQEDVAGIGQPDSIPKYGIGESIGRSGEIIEDDYGIAVQSERFIDIVAGVDPSKFAGSSGRIGDDVARRGFGYGVDTKRSSAKVSEEEDNDGADDVDDQALEAIDLSEGTGIIRGRNGRAPTKVIAVSQKIEVLAEVSFVPLEGRVDAQAARQSVRALQPRQVVVLGGPATTQEIPEYLVDEVSLLAEAAMTFASGDTNVEIPSDGETTEVHVGHAAYAARLIDTPYLLPEEREACEELPGPIEFKETKLGACTVSKLKLVATGQKVALDGSFVLAPRVDQSSDDSPSLYLSEGEILLTDLRAELIAQGMKADYKTMKGHSQLVVNGGILVKKEQQSGKLHVEGPLCEDFYRVRGIVCSQFVVL
jgi:cleavage and polyadenylation specificity factor subunit 2